MSDGLLQIIKDLNDGLAAGDPVAALIIGATGLVMGGLLSSLVFRLPIVLLRDAPHGEALPRDIPDDLAARRPFCMLCGHWIAWRHSVPILGYLLLLGRCATCGSRISLRYPLIETLACGVSLVALFRFGGDPAMVAAMVLSFALIAVTFIDYGEMIIPDLIVLPVLWLGLLCNLYELFTPLPDAVLGAIAGYLTLWSIHWIYKIAIGKEGLGHGDFKLLAMLGAWLGASALPFILFLAFAAGSIYGIALIIVRSAGRTTKIPFGPFLSGAGWITLYWQPAFYSLYWDWVLSFG